MQRSRFTLMSFLNCFSSVPCMECSLYYLITVIAKPKHITPQNCNLTVFCSCPLLFTCSVWEIKKFAKRHKNYHLELPGKHLAISFGHVPVIILFLLLSVYVFVKIFEKVMFERAWKREKFKIRLQDFV